MGRSQQAEGAGRPSALPWGRPPGAPGWRPRARERRGAGTRRCGGSGSGGTTRWRAVVPSACVGRDFCGDESDACFRGTWQAEAATLLGRCRRVYRGFRLGTGAPEKHPGRGSGAVVKHPSGDVARLSFPPPCDQRVELVVRGRCGRSSSSCVRVRHRPAWKRAEVPDRFHVGSRWGPIRFRRGVGQKVSPRVSMHACIRAIGTRKKRAGSAQFTRKKRARAPKAQVRRLKAERGCHGKFLLGSSGPGVHALHPTQRWGRGRGQKRGHIRGQGTISWRTSSHALHPTHGCRYGSR